MIYKFMKNKALVSFLLTSILFFITQYFYGLHYGWIDDIIQNNYFQGIGISATLDKTFSLQILLSKIYHALYQKFPEIPWYGYFSTTYVFLATFNLIFFLILSFSRFYEKYFIYFIVLISLIYFSFWVEFVFLLTFTKTAIILIGTSILLLDKIVCYDFNSRKKIIFVLYLSITLLLGMLNRPEVIVLLIVPLCIYLFKNKRTDFLRIIGILIVNMIVFVGIYFHEVDHETRMIAKKIAHISNISDGKNTYEKPFYDWLKEDIRYKSLFLYYWPDQDLISTNNLNKWGPQSMLSWSNFNNISAKLKYEISKAKYGYSDEYCYGLNWWNYFLFCILMNIILLVIGYYLLKDKQLKYFGLQFFSTISFLSLLLTLLLLVKLESRIVLPSIFIVNLISISLMSKNIDLNITRNKSILLIVIMFPLFIYQWNLDSQISKDRKKGELLNEKFISELNYDFHDKIIFFDVWTLSLLHTSLFKNIQLNKSNSYISHNEYWSNFIPANVIALNKICSTNDFSTFYKCLSKNKEKYVFVFTKDLRIGFIEEYAKKVHHLDLRFKKIHDESVLNKIHYSIIPNRYDFSYYQIEDISNL